MKLEHLGIRKYFKEIKLEMEIEENKQERDGRTKETCEEKKRPDLQEIGT